MPQNLKNKRQHRLKILSNQSREIDLLLSSVWFDSQIGEEWREIKDTDSKYFISNKGRVLSLCMDGYLILQPFVCGEGYYCVSIKVNGVWKTRRINVLVAEYFQENPDNKTIVHHKNLKKFDNDVSNLIYMTPQEHRAEHARLERIKNEPLLSAI